MLKLEKPVNKLYQAPNIPRVHTLSPPNRYQADKSQQNIIFPNSAFNFYVLGGGGGGGGGDGLRGWLICAYL